MKPEYTNVSSILSSNPTEECIIAFYLNAPIMDEELKVTGNKNIEVACVAVSMEHLRKLHVAIGETLEAFDNNKAIDTSRT